MFTPAFLVRDILDVALYTGERILGRHVMDNSCGDGAFLCEVVSRYCSAFLAAHPSPHGLEAELERYVHGIELDGEAWATCLYNLDAVAHSFGLGAVKWDVLNANALGVTRYNGAMDYVVGNPPYVRVHNLEGDYNEVKRFRFAQGGMTDLYLVFYELGLAMLSPHGRLCYITPSSWLSSVAATEMRHHILRERTLSALVDLGHFQAFPSATTYTMIALFEAGPPRDTVAFHTYSPEERRPLYVCDIAYDDLSIGGNFYVGRKGELDMLRDIKTSRADRHCKVKNGFATLADKVFISGVGFSDLTIPVLKASTGKWQRALFPYDEHGKPLPREHVFSFPSVAAYLNDHKAELLKGKTEGECQGWYLYGRSQALRDVHENKYAINTVVRDVASLRLETVPPGSGLYSGLYILTQVPLPIIEGIVRTDNFMAYLRMLRKYKSGGYYTFNSADLEQYLNAMI